MRSPAHEFNLYVETTGPFAADAPKSEAVFHQASMVVAQHTGEISYRGPYPVRLNAKGSINPRTLNALRFGDNVLYTTRFAQGDDGSERYGACYREVQADGVSVSRAVLTSLENSREARLVTVHEIGHSFGLCHCLGRFCVMGEEEFSPAVWLWLSRKSDPFCEDCASHLRSKRLVIGKAATRQAAA